MEKLRELIRKGDVIVMWRLDRLRRSLRHLIDVRTDLEKQGIGFQNLQEEINTTAPGPLRLLLEDPNPKVSLSVLDYAQSHILVASQQLSAMNAATRLLQ